MQVQELAIADGRIESVRTSTADAEIIFSDWQETKWRLTFVDVLAVENLNIEGEDLDRVEVRNDDIYIDHIRELVDEPN